MKKKRIIFIALIAIITTLNSSAQNLNVTLASQYTFSAGINCSNICGYVDTVGNEYALVGLSSGVQIIDVTNPAVPVFKAIIPGTTSDWREIKVRGNYAYVTNEGGGGLKIINLSSLPSVAGIVNQNWTGDSITGSINTIHTLHIDGNYVYLYGSNRFN